MKRKAIAKKVVAKKAIKSGIKKAAGRALPALAAADVANSLRQGDVDGALTSVAFTAPKKTAKLLAKGGLMLGRTGNALGAALYSPPLNAGEDEAIKRMLSRERGRRGDNYGIPRNPNTKPSNTKKKR